MGEIQTDSYTAGTSKTSTGIDELLEHTEVHTPTMSEELNKELDWHKQRIGKFTGSQMKNLMSEGRGKDQLWGETAKGYVFEKLYERVSNSWITIPETFAMSKGKEIEEDAMRVFVERTKYDVSKAEFMLSKHYDFIGASPDGLVHDYSGKLVGVWETKCRLDTTMLKNAFVPVTEKHDAFWQLQTEMHVAGVKQAFFTHYNDERECPFDLQIQVVKYDENAVNRMVERCIVADDVINRAIREVGKVIDKRISYITLTERMMKMREFIWENLK